MAAVREDFIEAVELLCTNNVDVTAKNDDCQTALMIAQGGKNAAAK